MENNSAKTCCEAGQPKEDSYKCKGTEFNLSPELKAYQVGQNNPKGLILIYDIFGFDIKQTRRFADFMAEDNFNVIMPDVFRGKPWSLNNFPPKEFSDLMKWIDTAGAYSIVKKDMELCQKHLISTGTSGQSGILGFCYGGKIALAACSADPQARCGVSIHGVGISTETVPSLERPMLFLPAGDDPVLDDVELVLRDHPRVGGGLCKFHRFDNTTHGFASARGDWNDQQTRNCILKAVQMSKDFLNQYF